MLPTSQMPDRLYVVAIRPGRRTSLPLPDCTPERYGLPLPADHYFRMPIFSPYAEQVRTFPSLDEVLSFLNACALYSCECEVYDRADSGWQLNERECEYMVDMFY